MIIDTRKAEPASHVSIIILDPAQCDIKIIRTLGCLHNRFLNLSNLQSPSQNVPNTLHNQSWRGNFLN